MKYSEWFYEWLEYYVKPTAKERTSAKYVRQAQMYILPSLGEVGLECLSASVLQRYAVELTTRGLSTNTVNGILSILKSSLRRAVLFGAIEREYTASIVRPRLRERQVDSFSKSEQKKIEEYIAISDKQKHFGILLCLYTGMRIGELLALEWEDIDLSRGVIRITKTCYDSWDENTYVKKIDTPKTACSVRTIPIPHRLISKIRQQKKQASSTYVVEGKGDQGVGIRSYQRTFEGILNELGISHKGFHSLRHTFATRALECGMDIKTLSEILGHTNASITLKRYAHSMLEHKTEMMNRLGRLLC